MVKLKFGVFLPFYAFQAKDQGGNFSTLRGVVSECERLGYHSVWLDDHLMYGNWPILESWTTLSVLAASTSTIRLGTMVSCLAHRNPALLAKMAASFDVISGGRLELGIGAGVGEAEHVAYGFDFPKTKIRVEHLAEAAEVIKRLWTQDQASFQGKHYCLKDAVCMPKPVQKLNPPMIVGGSSDLLLRKVTAPYADRVDFGYLPSVELYRRKLSVLEKACKTVERSFVEIEKSCWPGGQVIIASDEKGLEEKIARKNVLHLSQEEFRKVTLTGTPSMCRKQLKVWVNLGVTSFMLYFGDLPSLDGLQLFAENVINEIRG